MKTIKIFLASSEELDYDRMVFGNLVRRLDDLYEKRGIRIKLFEWEDYDAAFNDQRKQDEYNEQVRESDIFLALFHKKAGEFTIEEYNTASESFKEHASPKVYTFCKDLKPGEEESPELAAFKTRLFEEMGHYWCRYDTRESLQFQFVMQLQLVENSQMSELKVENGNIIMDGIRIAPMDKLSFAAANEDYQKKAVDLQALSSDIESFRLQIQNLDGNEAVITLLNTELQKKLDNYNKLKKEFEQLQQQLFNTAKRIAQLQGEHITKQLRRAMDAFSEGKVHEANIILDEALANDEQEFEDYKQSKEITELKRQKIIHSIEAYWFRANTIMADASLPIEERVTQAEQNYEHADDRAKETDYNKGKYAKLLMDYGFFLQNYSKFNKAIEIYQRQITISEAIYGIEHPKTAASYNNIGDVYRMLNNNQKALEYLSKALVIDEKTYGAEHPNTATSHNNIGVIYEKMGNYSEALRHHLKALSINTKTLGIEDPHTASSYNNIGVLHARMGDYQKALEFFFKAFHIEEKILGKEHPSLVTTYNNIGNAYDNLHEYQKALNYYFKALEIAKTILGPEHLKTGIIYSNIGWIYNDLCNYNEALEFFLKQLAIYEKVYSEDHPETLKVKKKTDALKQKLPKNK